ncbi:hypothetical protein [Nocardia sp. NPDC050793]|uniref:hypothetical protein n=1 Tax=Nocardia sp. NPDC050793 TaxID=3155159 RepID=UPI0033C358BB
MMIEQPVIHKRTSRTEIRSVTAAFAAEDIDCPVTLGELRAALVAIDLPDDAVVEMQVCGVWYTPGRIRAEQTLSEEFDPSALDPVDADEAEAADEYDDTPARPGSVSDPDAARDRSTAVEMGAL